MSYFLENKNKGEVAGGFDFCAGKGGGRGGNEGRRRLRGSNSGRARVGCEYGGGFAEKEAAAYGVEGGECGADEIVDRAAVWVV